MYVMYVSMRVVCVCAYVMYVCFVRKICNVCKNVCTDVCMHVLYLKQFGIMNLCMLRFIVCGMYVCYVRKYVMYLG